MNYKKMIEKARAKGIANEKAMWLSIDDVDDMIEMMKDAHPEEYANFMRKTHENLYGHHYDEEFAKHDIDRLEYTDKEGHSHHGSHWTKDEITSATQGKVFPVGTTEFDKWVGYNAIYADLSKHFSDSDILDIAYLFFFADEDYHGKGKVWDYMTAMH